MYIDPTREQIEAFGAAMAADDSPVFMLNLLRFAADGGAESYAEYAVHAAPHIERVGAEVVWAGGCHPALIGPGEREWDVVAIVRYPSRAKFIEMVTDPGYQAITKHRTAGLADSRLVPCTEAPLGA